MSGSLSSDSETSIFTGTSTYICMFCLHMYEHKYVCMYVCVYYACMYVAMQCNAMQCVYVCT